MKDFYILAIDEKSKIKYHECGAISPNCIEAFHIEANSFEEAISIIKDKTSKRFLQNMQIKEVSRV